MNMSASWWLLPSAPPLITMKRPNSSPAKTTQVQAMKMMMH
jgi:hypothetical protein